MAPELLPDLGRIWAEAGILGGASWNPYEVGLGFHLGGFFNVPLVRVPGGKLSYELLVCLSDAMGPATARAKGWPKLPSPTS